MQATPGTERVYFDPPPSERLVEGWWARYSKA